MRGEVLHYDEGQGFGFITGSDGSRYTFTREDLRREAAMSKGTQVEFQPSGGQARDVFAIRAQLGSAPAAQSTTQPTQHFGRDAVAGSAPSASASAGPESTGLWSYFWRGITSNYANFRGRARRKEYWGFYLFWIAFFVLAAVAGLVADSAAGSLDVYGDIPAGVVTAIVGFVLVTLIPCIAVTVRRQHDIGLSGWFFLLILVPYVGNLIIFVFSLIPTQTHENKWGPVPAGIRVPQPFTPTASGTVR